MSIDGPVWSQNGDWTPKRLEDALRQPARKRRPHVHRPRPIEERRAECAAFLEVKLKFLAAYGGRCADCGFSGHHSALAFDHRDPDAKDGSVMGLLRGKGWDAAAREAEKCDLVCANCHAVRTWNGREVIQAKIARSRAARRIS